MKKHVPLLAILLSSLVSLASAQTPQAVDPALRPPKGSQVALVVFEDLECPQCRRAAPLVQQASRNYKIPVVRHDFPLGRMHPWSTEAAIMAHYFDSQSKQLGNEFRDYMFQHQPEIFVTNLRQFADKFAADHKVDLPFVVDPQGKFAAEVNAERDLGIRLGVHQTPTIYVVSSKGKPVEVSDINQLFQTIDAVMNQ